MLSRVYISKQMNVFNPHSPLRLPSLSLSLTQIPTRVHGDAMRIWLRFIFRLIWIYSAESVPPANQRLSSHRRKLNHGLMIRSRAASRTRGTLFQDLTTSLGSTLSLSTLPLEKSPSHGYSRRAIINFFKYIYNQLFVIFRFYMQRWCIWQSAFCLDAGTSVLQLPAFNGVPRR